MASLAQDTRHEEPAGPAEPATPPAPPAPTAPPPPAEAPEAGIGHVPRMTIDAFCETPATAEVLEDAASDRRMSRAKLTIRQGGIGAAAELYRNTPTPSLIILESHAGREALIAQLDALATVCDADTKVFVIGESNDIVLYRDLLKRGITEYIIAPADPLSLISLVSATFSEPGARKLGRVYAFIGAKGGVGSSSMAHNVAWTLGRHSGAEVILADMDLAFGTASLNFDLEPTGGIADAIRDAERLDEQMLERLLVECDDHLKLLAAPTLLETPRDDEAVAFAAVIELAQGCAPHLVLDIPHLSTAWSRTTLRAADEVVITAAPDLANLKNAKHLVELLRESRPNDSPPRLVLNQVGTPGRPEIDPRAFADALGLEPVISLPFDAKAFGSAANRGRMVAESSRNKGAVRAFRRLAESVSGRPLRRRGFFGGLGSMLRLRTSRSRGA